MLALLALFTLKILGYQFNLKTNTVDHTGLVQYDSFPRNATITTNGARQGVTKTKSLLLPGTHQFSMQLKGYEGWQKTVAIKPGTITWLSYVRLVPEERRTLDIPLPAGLTELNQDPDSRYMAGIATAESEAPTLVLIDLRNSRQPKVAEHALNTEKLTGMDDLRIQHNFSIARWSVSGRYLLVKHGFDEKTEWLWFDRDNPGELVNISTLVNLAIDDIQIADNDKVYILQDNGDVRQLTVRTGAVTRPLLSRVSEFGVFDSKTVYYIARQDDQQVAGVWREGWRAPAVLMSTMQSDDSPLHISVSRYFHQDIIAISNGAVVEIYRGTLSTNEQEQDRLMAKSQAQFSLKRPLTTLQIGSSGRFVVAENDTSLVSYDLELMLASQQIKKYSPDPVAWLDQYHIWQINKDGTLEMTEFDGVNSYELMPVMAKGVLLTRDGKFVYGIARDESGAVVLRQLSMTID